MINDFITGFLLELGLIVTVGLQSAFILKQGIKNEFVMVAVLACFFSEAFLVTIGIAGMGVLVTSIPYLYQIITLIGIIFLFFYGIKSLYTAIKKNDYINLDADSKSISKKEVLLSSLAFSLLNPHVIIDTTIMGSLSANFYPHQWIFGAGVITAAFLWYLFLGKAGVKLARFLNNIKTWKIINILIAIMCFYVALHFIENFNEEHHEHNYINLFKIFGIGDMLEEIDHH